MDPLFGNISVGKRHPYIQNFTFWHWKNSWRASLETVFRFKLFQFNVFILWTELFNVFERLDSKLLFTISLMDQCSKICLVILCWFFYVTLSCFKLRNLCFLFYLGKQVNCLKTLFCANSLMFQFADTPRWKLFCTYMFIWRSCRQFHNDWCRWYRCSANFTRLQCCLKLKTKL